MGGAGQTKRIKELKRQERNQEKAAERERRREVRAKKPQRTEDGEDPDIAGIVPGPQTPPEID